MTNLTTLEQSFLTKLIKEHNPDDYNCTEDSSWFAVDSASDLTGIDVKQLRGIISSLLKKGVIFEADDSHGFKYFQYDFPTVPKTQAEAFKNTQDKLALEKETIKNLLCCAFEGGSNYWYMIDTSNLNEFPEGTMLSDLLAESGSSMVISDASGDEAFEPKTVTHLDVLKAWETFRKDSKYKRHYDDAVNSNDDATTGDVFLQLVVFGEVIFG